MKIKVDNLIKVLQDLNQPFLVETSCKVKNGDNVMFYLS